MNLDHTEKPTIILGDGFTGLFAAIHLRQQQRKRHPTLGAQGGVHQSWELL